MEASGPAVVPVYRPSPDAGRPYAPPGPPTGATEKLAWLWRARRFIWGVLWKTFVAAVVVAVVLPVHYDSVTKIVPGETDGGALKGKIARGASVTGMDLGLDTASLLGIKTQYTDLYRQAKIQESVYEFLTRQLETAKIQEAKELPTVRQMDRAVQEEKKSGPSRILIVGLSLVWALGLACCWVLGRSAWEQCRRAIRRVYWRKKSRVM